MHSATIIPCAEAKINILDISQTIMQNMFTMIMLVDTKEATESVEEISKKLNSLGEEMGLSMRIQHEDVFNSMHRI